MSFAATPGPLGLCRVHTNGSQFRLTFRRTHLRTMRATHWRVARRVQSLFTTGQSCPDTRQNGSASLRVQSKARIYAQMASRPSTQLRAYGPRLLGELG